MGSKLITTKVENLQRSINKTMEEHATTPGIYVALNKTQRSVEKLLLDAELDISKIFFIDCVTMEKGREDVLHIQPDKIDMILAAIKEFVRDLDGNKYVLIDAVSSLLIYNSEQKVLNFIKELTSHGQKYNAEIIALAPETRGEDLLNHVSKYFDKIEK